MSDDSGVHFLTARSRKRPHHQMSGASRNHSQPAASRQGDPSSSRTPRQRSPLSSSPPPRYVGDGLDFRRPAMSSAQQEPVIDLTEEPDSSPQHTRPRQGTPSGTTPRASRPPRFERDILSEPDVDVVDLVNEPDSPVAARDPNRRPPTSPDVEFVRATSRPPQPRPRPQPPGRSSFFSMMRRSAQLWPHHFLPLDMETIWIGEGGGPGIDLELDLDMRGLATPPPGPPAPASSYKPPSPAPEGFTRSAGEDELVVCPNCEVELGTGDEQKQQVWVAKPCGHVYCGECAKNRSLSKSKKSAQKTKPFSKCQVLDCGKSVSSPKSMIQIYL